MKFCNNCGVSLPDDATFCTSCGTPLGAPMNANPAPGYAPNPGYAPAPGYAPVTYAPVDPFDHTSEFDPKDISDNKVICMLMYLASYAGILVALLMSNSSKYVAFHLRQALKFEVATILLGILGAIGSIILIGPFVAGIGIVVLAVVRVICFFQICKGQAKEPAIIRNLKFMK